MVPPNLNLKPASKHKHAPSLETNASAIAESTISLGQISRFPEPPSSIPNSPMRSAFDTSSGPSTPTSRYYPQVRRLPVPPPTSYTRSTDSGPSLHSPLRQHPHPPPQPQNPPPYSAASSQPSKSTPTLSAHDWHDGASSIDVDGAEDRLLPTSLITSLLQENRLKRESNATSFAFSGISEITYPPVAGHSTVVSPSTPGFGDKLLSRAQQEEASMPSQSKRYSTESDAETLASMGNYPIQLIRSASHAHRASVQQLSTISSLGELSAHDSETIRSTDKLFHHKLSTTYEDIDEFQDAKGFGAGRQEPVFLSMDPASNRAADLKIDTKRGSKSSFQSTKTTASFLSRISNTFSIRRAWVGRRNTKPLPPIPTIPTVSVADEQAYRKLEEASPLPDLIHRAGAVRAMLERGHRPDSALSTPAAAGFRQASYNPNSYNPTSHQSYSYYPSTQAQSMSEIQEVKTEGSIRLPYGITVPNPFYSNPTPSGHQYSADLKRKRKIKIYSGIAIFVIVAVIGVVVGVVVGRRKQSAFNCQGSMTGSSCNLDATCVCTSTNPCNPLAQSVIDYLPAVNDLFSANYTAASAYQSLWLMQGTPNDDCSAQAELMDTGKGFDHATFPNRTRWLQAVLLWNALQTLDPAGSGRMQSFVQSLPWKDLNGAGDSPNTSKGSSYSMTAFGYTYDFAAQTVTQPTATFATQGQPSNQQISRVSSNAKGTLDRMYTYAQASSNQRTTALQRYWTSVLQQRSDSLATFKAALRVSPILLPFNASTPSVRNLYTSSSTSTFPPPLSCYPGLDSSTQQQLNSFETATFNLPNVTAAKQFDTGCFADRPVYGVLDILQLRLPYSDSVRNVPEQAVRLDVGAVSRLVIYSREASNGNSIGAGALSPLQLDPRQYGTMNYMDHVVLQYLTALPDISTAHALVSFVLQQATGKGLPTPPDPSSLLRPILDKVPVLEVAVFGQVTPSDVSSVISPFTLPSGALFFGSDDGTALRNWTIGTMQKSVVWTENATSPTVLRDNIMDSSNIISQTWSAAAAAIDQHATNVGLVNVTNSLGPQFAP